MRRDGDVAQLAEVSRRLGADRAYVQGGGGNTSLKHNDGMWIKASGLALANVTAEDGFVLVDDRGIKEGLSSCSSETDYDWLLAENHLAGRGRPSLETGFHSVLTGRALFHSHAIAANILCCTLGGEAWIAQRFPEALWIDYTTPGLPLTNAIVLAMERQGPADVVFLQNHGLIVGAQDVDAAWSRHDAVCRRILDEFALDAGSLMVGDPVEADAAHVLFPDQVIYLQNEKLRDSTPGQETLAAYSALRRLIPRLGLVPRYLSIDEGNVLTSMEAEKYRQKVAGACL